MSRQINFEVQVMQGGRWSIHARYPATGHDEAIDDAKTVERSGIGKVRVLRDIYDTDLGTSTERVIYASFGMDKMSGSGEGDASLVHGSSQGSVEEYDFDGDDFDFDSDSLYNDDEYKAVKRKKKARKKATRKPTSIPMLLVKLLLIILASVAVAVAMINFANPYIHDLNIFGTHLVGNTRENALIIIFLFTFSLSALSMASLMLKNTRLKAAKRRPAPRQQVHQVAHPQPVQTPQEIIDAEAQNLKDDLEPNEMDRFREEAAEAARQNKNDNDNLDPDENDAPPPAPQEEEEPQIELTPHGEKQKAYMMKFIKRSMTAAGKEQLAMSNFEKFGISLYLAGACEVLAEQKDLDKSALDRIMADSVQTMGFKRVHAKNFASKHDEYLVQDPTYMQMFQAGRNSMNTYMEDEASIIATMSSAMSSWKAPKKKETESGPITVFFTDIAGSTAMTQEYGDAGAQYIVRSHNKIVRAALSAFSGKEIKHTGDGIMASFTRTSDSIDAAIQIQRETDIYTTATPERPLHIKIGINAGEPISEDNDLFGTTVQMAARIVDKAKADQIFVSEIIKGISAGKNYNFINRGSYPLKGFATDPVLYEVMWKAE